MKMSPSLRNTAIISSLALALALGACGDLEENGDDDPGQGIVGAWVGNGDALVWGVQVEDDDAPGGQLPEEGMPSLGSPVDGCDFARGLELYPSPDIALRLDPADSDEGSGLSSDQWVTTINASESSFSLNFDGDVSVPEDPENVGGAHFRTGANTYIVDIYHPDPDSGEAFNISAMWSGSTSYRIPQIEMDPPLEFDTAEIDIALSSSASLFVTSDDGCEEVELDDEIFAMTLDEESEDAEGSQTLSIDGERATIVLHALGEVEIDSRTTGSMSSEMVTADLDAFFSIQLLDD